MNIYNPFINTIEPFQLNSYSYHFMKHGSFEHEGNIAWKNKRVDMNLLDEYLNFQFTNVKPNLINDVPTIFSLEQNFPNPFNPTTTINYSIPRNCKVELRLYDLLGTEIRTLVNAQKTAGIYKVIFNGGFLPSGVYFYRLSAGLFYKTKKFVLMR